MGEVIFPVKVLSMIKFKFKFKFNHADGISFISRGAPEQIHDLAWNSFYSDESQKNSIMKNVDLQIIKLLCK